MNLIIYTICDFKKNYNTKDKGQMTIYCLIHKLCTGTNITFSNALKNTSKIF